MTGFYFIILFVIAIKIVAYQKLVLEAKQVLTSTLRRTRITKASHLSGRTQG